MVQTCEWCTTERPKPTSVRQVRAEGRGDSRIGGAINSCRTLSSGVPKLMYQVVAIYTSTRKKVSSSMYVHKFRKSGVHRLRHCRKPAMLAADVQCTIPQAWASTSNARKHFAVLCNCKRRRSTFHIHAVLSAVDITTVRQQRAAK